MGKGDLRGAEVLSANKHVVRLESTLHFSDVVQDLLVDRRLCGSEVLRRPQCTSREYFRDLSTSNVSKMSCHISCTVVLVEG